MSRKVHGESAGTRPKEANLSAIITVEFLRRVFAAKDPFVYIDANAGSGYNAMSNTHGSPLIALNNLRGWVRRSRWRQAPPCAAYLIERDPRHMASLRQALLARESQGRLFADDTVWPTLVFRESDNRFALPELAKTIIDTFGRGVHGVAFFDPNGIFTRDQSRSNSKLQWFPPIQELAAQLPNVAMVFDLNRDAASRVDGVRRNGQLRMAEPMWATDLLDAVRRRFALVTPMRERKKWAMLCATNNGLNRTWVRTPEVAWYRTEEARGKVLLRGLSNGAASNRRDPAEDDGLGIQGAQG